MPRTNMIAAWRLLCSLTLAGVALGCGSQEVLTQCVRHELMGGGPRAELLALDARQERAVVRVEVQDELGPLGVCAGIWVGKTRVLTARHCTNVEGASALNVHFNSEAGPDVDAAVVHVQAHPTLDLAMLTLPETATVPADVVAIPPTFDEVPRDGDVLQIAGFETLLDQSFAVTSIVAVNDSSFTVSSDGRAGPCEGDSGAPALVRDAAANAAAVGVLTGGMKSCAGTDDYVRLDAARDWLEAQGVATTPGDMLADCSLLPESGRCFGNVAVWCEEGAARNQFDACSSRESCGFSRAAGGFRCVPQGQDPCHQVGDHGTCAGDVLTRCEGGRLVMHRCDECAARCQISVASGDAICNAE